MRSSIATRTTRGRRRAITVFASAFVLASIGVSAALGADGNLPGGTAIEVTIDDPSADQTIEVDDEGATVDLTLTGTAAVGGAAVVKNTTLLYILDVSGSMRSSAGVDCDGDGSNDLRNQCQAEAVAYVNSLALDPGSPVGSTGVGTYGSSGQVLNLDLADGVERLLVEPAYDGNGNSVPDVEDVVRGLATPGNSTNFSLGLEQALHLLGETTTSVARIVFISDGSPNAGADVNSYDGEFDQPGFPDNVRIDSFAITSGAGCDNAGSGGRYGSLRDIASLGTTSGECVEVEDLSNLNFVLGQVLSSELTSVTGTIDGGEPQALTSVTPEPPLEGPASVDYVWEAGEFGVGTYEFCVTAAGTDGGGAGTVAQCRTITIAVPDPLPEGLHLAPETATASVGTEHTVTATLIDSAGEPVADAEVVIEVTDGPHAGVTTTATTDPDGRADLTYEGDEVGNDLLVASFTPDDGDDLTSNQATMEWVEVLAETTAEEASDDETDAVEEIEDADAAEAVVADPDFTG